MCNLSHCFCSLKDFYLIAQIIGMKLQCQHSTFEMNLLITAVYNSGAITIMVWSCILFHTKKKRIFTIVLRFVCFDVAANFFFFPQPPLQVGVVKLAFAIEQFTWIFTSTVYSNSLIGLSCQGVFKFPSYFHPYSHFFLFMFICSYVIYQF